jgi:hypothetical protein
MTRRHFLGRMLPGLAVSAGWSAERPLVLAISMNLAPDANLNDARASMQVWLDWAGRSHNMSVRTAPGVFIPSAELLEMIRLGRADAFALDVTEYRQVADLVDPRWMIVSDLDPQGGSEYALVVPRGGARSIAELRGKRIVRWRAPVTRLSDEWLAVEQARHGGPPDMRFWGSSSVEAKLSRVVLPVFFQQQDACLVTRRGFATMCEMNPQVGEKLRAILYSRRMRTGGYFFRKGCPPLGRERMLAAFSGLSQATYGRQVLMLFQSPNLVVRDVSCLNEAMDLVREYEKLKPHAS